VVRPAKPGSKSASAWLLALLERKPRKLSPLRSVCEAAIGGADRGAVALASKMARVAWAMMATGEAHRGSEKAAAPAAGAAAAA
jgi:transposase